MDFGLKDRIPIWITLAITGLLLYGSGSLFKTVESYRGKVFSPWFGGKCEITCHYVGSNFSTIQACSEQNGVGTSQNQFQSLSLWKDPNVEMQTNHFDGPYSLNFKLSKIEVAPYWSLEPPALMLTLEVWPKADADLPIGPIELRLSGCATLLPDYWKQDEEKAAEVLRKVTTDGNPELTTRAQAYIDELAKRKELLASAWRIQGYRQIEARSYSSALAVFLNLSYYFLLIIICLLGLVFGLTLLGYIAALKSS